MKPGQLFQWQDLIVLVDDGSIPRTEYLTIETSIRQQAKTCPSGVALIVILPANTKPPSQETKTAVTGMLDRVREQLSCLGYVIEGDGFTAIMTRATLVAMKTFNSRPYPVEIVQGSMIEMLERIWTKLVKGSTKISNAMVLSDLIDQARTNTKP